MPSTDELRKLIEPEDLDPELEAYVEEGPHFTSIKHPLVFSVMHTDAMNGLVNAGLRSKREALERARAERSWHTIVFLHERPYRLQAFAEIEDQIEDDGEWWEQLGFIWTDSENIWQNLGLWREFLDSDRSQRERIMDEDERAYLASLPERITIYRGYKYPSQLDGYSWTLDREKAEWFAKRLWSDGDDLTDDGVWPTLATATVERSNVIAYFNGRAEQEIVALEVQVERTDDIEP